MAIKLKHNDSYLTWFVTFTCADWIPLIEITNSYDLVYKWFGILKERYHADVLAYVIMPNHLHVIVHFQKEGFNLNSIVGNCKRFMAYEIIKRFERSGNTTMLHQLKGLVTERESKKGQLHKVFIDSFDAKPIFTHPFLMQKIDYIHHNPVRGKWMLAEDLTDYEHSSASFYELQLVRHFRPMHYLDL